MEATLIEVTQTGANTPAKKEIFRGDINAVERKKETLRYLPQSAGQHCWYDIIVTADEILRHNHGAPKISTPSKHAKDEAARAK